LIHAPHRRAPNDTLAVVRESLLRNYFTDRVYLASELGQKDFRAHLELRLRHSRERVIPWLKSFHPLAGARVLEIGCGTGSSTLALAESGAEVTAIDIRPSSLSVAYDRCKAHNCDVRFIVANATEVRKHFRRDSFDLVIFYAVLEHMTHKERRVGMGASWEVLKTGGCCVVTETPNRLWYRDNHTALLPFYHWLPDAVAFEYSRFSKRDYFRELYLTHTPERELHFLRRGRGISFHEFELFIAPRHELNVIGCLHTYFRALNPEEEQRWTVPKTLPTKRYSAAPARTCMMRFFSPI
jgi:ubiquinone/menaquinone biosynthesis C-methylase UbiE